MTTHFIDQAIAFLKTIFPIEKALEERLRSFLFVKVFSRRALLLEEGQVCSHVYFIVKGLVRIYSYRDNREFNSWILMENDLVVSPDSFFQRTPSVDYLQALEKTIVVGLSFEHLQQLYQEFHSFLWIGHILTGGYYAENHKRTRSLIDATNEERYQYLLENHARLAQRVPFIYLASYLVMSDSTLTRVKGKL